MKKPANKGISTVSGAVLFVILIFALQTTLFLALYQYNSSVQDAIKTENERIQEKIVLNSLITDPLDIQIYAIQINNTGSITVRIRAVYIDNQFLCDPSDKSINPSDTYVNSKETSWILMPAGTPYNATAQITAATERGTKSTDYEWRLKGGGGGGPPIRFDKFYLGPLMLDFVKFYYAKVDSQGKLTTAWIPGWRIETSTGAIAWNITVTNIDDRDITINQYCVFTLWANDQPSSRLPWYIEPPQDRLSQRIKPNETVSLVYKWSTPKTNSTKLPNTQSIYATDCRCRTILTFFGIFHEPDGTTKPYGQTIPFEAVLVERLGITIAASRSVLVIGSTMTSTITATVTRNNKPVAGENITFTTTAGTLSSPWAITDANGQATVTLSALTQTTPADALVTATWTTWTGKTASVIVRLVKETITVTASPTVLVVNSTMKSTITAVIKVEGNPYAGASVTFTTNAGSLSSPVAITDATGTARVYLTAGTSPVVANVTAIWINTPGSATVRFVVETIQVTASPTVIAVNSAMKSTITANVTLESSPMTGANVTFTTDAGTLSSSWAITDSNGIARVNLTAGMSPALANITAKWVNTIGSTTVLFVLDTVQISASPTVLVIGSTTNSTITATVTRNSNPVTGANVSFTTTAGTLSKSWALTDLNGVATVNLTARWWTTPTTATVTATWITISGPKTDSTTVLLTMETIRVEAEPTVIATNSTMESKITALVTVNGNPVVGANVTFATNASNLSSSWAVTNASGAAWVYLNASMSPTVANVTAIWINTLNWTTVRITNLYVTTDKLSYSPNETVHISGFLRHLNGTPIQGGIVTINITAPNGTVWSVDSTITDSEGWFTYDFELGNSAPGTYTIMAKYEDYVEICTFTVV